MNNVMRVFLRPSLATTLFIAALDAFDTGDANVSPLQAMIDLSPHTLFLEITQDAGGEPLPENYHKLMAALELISSNNFEQSESDFIRLCNILSDSPTLDGSFDPAEPHEIAWALTERAILTGRPLGELSQAVVGYVEFMLRDQGFASVPSLFQDIVPQGDILPDFTGDPEIFSAVNDLSSNMTGDITAFVTERVNRLRQEVAALPLRRPLPQDWIEQALKDAGDASSAA